MTYTPPTTVYAIKPTGMRGPWKIGCAAEPGRRLREIQTWSPLALEIVATAPGTLYDEKQIHRHLKAYRLHGEWFSDCSEVRAFVDYLRIHRSLPAWARRDIPADSTYLSHWLRNRAFQTSPHDLRPDLYPEQARAS